ncbi:MAG: WD40/YVTN/BNR-like repeat-containing protein [Chloroflexota bacterium]
MKTIRKRFILLCCTATVLLLLLFSASQNAESGLASLFYREGNPRSPLDATPTTLLETWDIVEKYIRDNTLNMAITELMSVDHPGDSSITAPGADGHRRAWMAMLANDTTLLRMTVWDGEVIDQSTSPLDMALPVAEKPAIDSFAIYAAAKEKYPSLEPNGNHGRGFHFGIGVDEQGQTVLSVIGGKAGGTLTNDMIIMANPSSGELVRALVRTFDKAGGILFSDDGGITWHSSNLSGVMTMAIAKDLYHPNQAYAVVSDGVRITLYSSTNGGKTWSNVGQLPPDAGNWVASMEIVPGIGSTPFTADQAQKESFVVTTRHGAWVSSDCKDWSQIAGLPAGPIQWTAMRNGQQNYQVFVSVIDGPEKDKGLYASSNLVDWEKVQDKGYYRLSESYDKTQVMAIEQNSDRALLFTRQGSEAIVLPSEANDAAGDFSRPEHTVLRTSSAVGNLSLNASNELSTMDIAVIAAAPDFLESGLVIAGGFRSGIYRSEDFGKSWKVVLANPSSIVPGNNEIWSVVFLSENSLIAVNGGSLTWEALP